MAEKTSISWTDATWNPWVGCQKTGSPACAGCYAEHLVSTRFGRAVWGGPHIGVGTRSRTSKSTWGLPARLERRAIREGRVLFCFCASLADIFDPAVPPEWRREAFDKMRAAPHVVFLLLTKRPHLITKLAKEAGGLPPNAAIGCTVVTQAEADRDIPHLINAGAELQPQFLFLSIEPMMEQIDIEWALRGWISIAAGMQRRGHFAPPGERIMPIGWVITGGGTNQGKWQAPPVHPDWNRSVRDQCARTGTPYQHKQNGEWAVTYDRDRDDPDWQRCPEARHHGERYVNLAGGHGFHGERVVFMKRVGKKKAGRELDGVTHDARPEVKLAA